MIHVPRPPQIRVPQVETIWVIAPTHRPECLPRISENFLRQRFPGKKLVIAGNGPVDDSMVLVRGAAFVRSREHQSAAKNAALDLIRSQGGGFFTTFDDDDYYSADYLDELAGWAKQAEVIGKSHHFISLSEGTEESQLLLVARNRFERESSWLTGGTVSGFVEEALPFPEVSEGEEIFWCERMRAKGARIFETSVYHYLYRRSYLGAQHTWHASTEIVLRTVKAKQPIEYAPASGGGIDLRIVDGTHPLPEARLLGSKNDFKPTEASTY